VASGGGGAEATFTWEVARCVSGRALSAAGPAGSSATISRNRSGVGEKAFRKGHNYDCGQRSRTEPGLYVAEDRKQSSPGRVLGNTDEGADGGHRGGGHVGSVYCVGGAPCDGRGKDRIGQVSCGTAFGRGAGTGAEEGEQHAEGGRRRPLTGTRRVAAQPAGALKTSSPIAAPDYQLGQRVTKACYWEST
jgi:hypothetical protein